MSDEANLPQKHAAPEGDAEPAIEKKAPAVEAPVDSDSYQPSDEESDYDPELLSDEQDHGEDEDFNMEEYLAFREAEIAKEKAEAEAKLKEKDETQNEEEEKVSADEKVGEEVPPEKAEDKE